jgi:hypothetical protein
MRGASHPSTSVGSDAGGFRIVSGADGNLRIAAWGYWPAEVISAFGASAPAATQALIPLGDFVFDSTELKPQGAAGQEALRMLFRALASLPFAKGLIIKGSAMTCMQLARLLRECSAESRIAFTDAHGLES